jgi:hypothetical protein
MLKRSTVLKGFAIDMLRDSWYNPQQYSLFDPIFRLEQADLTFQIAPGARKRLIGIYIAGGLVAGMLGLATLSFRIVCFWPSPDLLFSLAVTVLGFSFAAMALAVGLTGRDAASHRAMSGQPESG